MLTPSLYKRLNMEWRAVTDAGLISPTGKFPAVRKIACLRASRLGDFVVATPALVALRSAYPDAEICYLGTPMHDTLLANRPGPIDRVIVTPPKQGVRDVDGMPDDPAELDDFFDAMQRERFDLTIQMHGGGQNSNPFVLRLGARFTVGLRTPDAAPLDRWMPYTFWQNEIMRLLEVVRLAGAQATTLEPTIAVTERDVAEVRQRLPEVRGPYVVFHVGAVDLRRRWPPERFARVGDLLAAEGFQVVVLGAGDEHAAVERTIAAMSYPAVNAYERLSLCGLVGLLAGASLVVSNDSGPMHVAAAVGAPVVGLYWCTNFMNWSHLVRTRFRPLVSWITRCPGCGADMTPLDKPNNGCAHAHCFVEALSVDDVVAAAFSLLAQEQQVPP